MARSASADIVPKYAFVTGASAGIGKSLAKELFHRGYVVFAGARRVEKMIDLKSMGINVLQLDVTDSNSISAAFKEISDSTDGRLDVLFNNAGQGCPYPALEVTAEQISQCFNVNFFAIVLINQIFASLLIRSKGKIVMIGSTAGLIPLPFNSIYSASKAAVSAYSRSFRLEMKAYDVQVTTVISGSVDTNLLVNKHEYPETSIQNTPEGKQYDKDMADSVRKSKPMTPSIYATKVCDDILNSKNLKHEYYRGTSSSLIRVLSGYFPYFVLDFIALNVLGFNKLIKATREKLRDR